jgi:hypothetical protein
MIDRIEYEDLPQRREVQFRSQFPAAGDPVDRQVVDEEAFHLVVEDCYTPGRAGSTPATFMASPSPPSIAVSQL